MEQLGLLSRNFDFQYSALWKLDTLSYSIHLILSHYTCVTNMMSKHIMFGHSHLASMVYMPS